MFFDVQSVSFSALPMIFPSRLMKKVWGRLQTPYAVDTAASSSKRMGEVILCSFLYFRISFSFSLLAILMGTKSVFLNSSLSLANEGDSLLQFGHHVAKKFSKMILPRSSLREIFPPPSCFRVKSGASTATLSFSAPASLNWAVAIGVFDSMKIIRMRIAISDRRRIVIPPRVSLLNFLK